MAHGLPSEPPEPREAFEEAPDEFCPACGWDSESEEAQDFQHAFNAGALLAVEQAEGSPFTAMGAATLYAFYWRCPNQIEPPDDAECDCFIPALEGAGQHSPGCSVFKKRRCGHLFTTEVEDLTSGAMA